MSASNRAVVQHLFNDGLNNHDLSVMMELCSDYIFHMPLGGDLRGEALGQFFADLLNAFPDLQRTMQDMVSDGIQTVVIRWTATGTHLGPFMGIAPTGKRFTITGMSIHRVSDGKIVEEWQQWDSLGLLQQLDVVPSFQRAGIAA